MLSIWCMVRRKVIGLIVFNECYVQCDKTFFVWKNRNHENLKPRFFCQKPTETEQEITES